jgi:NAD-dependent dihydropyrimidine dehydrogenase PreA subunit
VKLATLLWTEIVQTLLRVLPFPCETGLVEIGRPGRDSPVILTCNYRLTVERVKRALEGIDAYLLVANSRGVNVWCAATGGLLSNHDVVSVLKTSGVGDRVDHRRVILPQLAATGIEGRSVRERTGWNVVWGPVEAAALPAFLRSGLEATEAMRSVEFRWPQRCEMAVAWAFPISLVGALLVLPFWRDALLPLVSLVWGMSLLVFLSFPLYQRRLGGGGKRIGFVFFDFGPSGGLLVSWLCFALALAGYAAATGELSWTTLLRWGAGSLVVLAILGLDIMGSTPTYKSGLHEDRLLRIALDEEKCRGAAFCEQVCPVDVFDIDRERRLASLARSERCVQCGACIVQCPFDALFFQHPDGGVLPPETIRRFKLNLIGKRVVRASESGRAGDPLR